MKPSTKRTLKKVFLNVSAALLTIAYVGNLVALEGRNILLAEDNDLNAEIAEAILERAGLRIERVENGIQCVNRILKMPAQILLL